MIPIETIGIIVGSIVGVSAISGIIVSIYSYLSSRREKEYDVNKELKELSK
jgi:hypothetical protein